MSSELNENYEGNSFEYRLKEVSDDEIISILRYRSQFQAKAVSAAIKEALKRGIISSVEELDDEAFKPQELPPRSLFPLGNNYKQNLAILKSLCRVFYGFGIVPVIYAYFQFSQNHLPLAVFSLLVGILVIFLANRLEKTLHPMFALALLGMNAPAIGFAIYKLNALGAPNSMDIFASVIMLMVLMYTTIYASKLVAFMQKETK
jgi:hypothetical protein